MAVAHVAPCAPAMAYLPATPSQVPKPVIDYARSMAEAPVVALGGVTADKKEIEPIEKLRRHRTRLQVGTTNRWRLPQSLLSDLLGVAQANRSLPTEFLPFNDSYIRVCTADSRHTHMNDDTNTAIPHAPTLRKQSLLSARYRLTEPITASPIKSSSTPRLAKSAPTKRVRDSITPLNSFVPSRARPSKPIDVFLYHSKQNPINMGSPDILLHCMGMDWELHSPILQKSSVLSELLTAAQKEVPRDTLYYKTPINDTLDDLVKMTGIYDNGVGASVRIEPERDEIKQKSHLAHISKVKKGHMQTLTLDITDPAVKKDAFAVVLGNLYHSSGQVETFELPSVLIAASAIGFTNLEEFCVAKMKTSITYANVCPLYQAALRSNQTPLMDSCKRWLECNLTVEMMKRIQLRDIPLSLLEAVLKSTRLFTCSEYHLYVCCATWLFLRMNPTVQLMPTSLSVITYFNSLPKHSSFLEREGQAYQPIFDCLRLHGLTDNSHLHNVRMMNILTQDAMVALLSEHYSSLQSGGDMALMRNFLQCSVRQGFVLDQELPYHSEIFSLHGFHFELKTVKIDGTFTFFMQRLKPTDPVLSFRQCERQTFSMRPDRTVKYCIAVQTMNNGEQTFDSTGVVSQRFSFNGKLMRSKALTLENVKPPLYVTFSFLFPQS